MVSRCSARWCLVNALKILLTRYGGSWKNTVWHLQQTGWWPSGYESRLVIARSLVRAHPILMRGSNPETGLWVGVLLQ